MYWAKLNHYRPSSQQDILKQRICYNSYLKVNKKVVTPVWSNNIIDLTLDALYDSKQKSYKTLPQLNEETSVSITQLQYNTLVTIIPKEWRRILQSAIKPPNNDNEYLAKMSQMIKPTKAFYRILLQGTMKQDDQIRYKWEKILDMEISEGSWRRIANVKRITMNTKLQAFQYRLINHAIVTNSNLYKWKKILSDKCYYCKEYEEMVTHLFVKCQNVQQKIWLPLTKWLDNFCYIKLPIDSYTIVFNEYKDSFPVLVNTGRERLIRSHSSARFSFELSGNSN